MDCVRNTSVCYCCVWKGGQILYSYNSNSNSGGTGTGDEIEKLGALWLEMSSHPPHHIWYFETKGKMKFGFFMYQGSVYFAILVNESSVVVNGSSQVLVSFLEKSRDEFIMSKSVGKQEQFHPVVLQLVASLVVAENGCASASSHILWPTCNNDKGVIDLHSTSSSQNLHHKWCRQVKIVVAVCVLLFVIWLVICHGVECIH